MIWVISSLPSLSPPPLLPSFSFSHLLITILSPPYFSPCLSFSFFNPSPTPTATDLEFARTSEGHPVPFATAGDCYSAAKCPQVCPQAFPRPGNCLFALHQRPLCPCVPIARICVADHGAVRLHGVKDPTNALESNPGLWFLRNGHSYRHDFCIQQDASGIMVKTYEQIRRRMAKTWSGKLWLNKWILQSVECWLMLTDGLSIKFMLCSIFQFLWYKYSPRDWFKHSPAVCH